MASPPVTIKKYSNRRLYDTDESRYVTLEELADKVRGGTDIRVLDAKSGADLTQATLAQIIIESRGAGKLLPVPLLTQLIRMRDDALAEFLGRYLSGALELYVQARSGAQSLSPYLPLATLPFAATNAFARLLSGVANAWSPVPRVGAPADPGPPPDRDEDIATLRRELEELKTAFRDAARKP